LSARLEEEKKKAEYSQKQWRMEKSDREKRLGKRMAGAGTKNRIKEMR